MGAKIRTNPMDKFQTKAVVDRQETKPFRTCVASGGQNAEAPSETQLGSVLVDLE